MKWRIINERARDDFSPKQEYCPDSDTIESPKVYKSLNEANDYVVNNALVGKAKPEIIEVSPRKYTLVEVFVYLMIALIIGILIGFLSFFVA